MAETLLVMTERQLVSKLLEIFDRKVPDLRVVVLAKFEEYSSTRLVLSSDSFDYREGLANYKEYGAILREMGPDFEDISLLPMYMNDPVIIALQKRFGPLDDPRGTHIGLQLLGNRYLEDGYVYRVR